MALTEQALERRARRAYELGRLGWAARMLLFVVPLLLIARLIGRPTILVVSVGSALALVSIGLAFVHLRYKQAALSGMAAALPALLLPWLLRFAGVVCVGGKCFDPCFPASVAIGGIAGMLVAVRALREERHWSFWLAAIAVVALLGALGCSVAGEAGVLGLLAGGALGSAPVLLRARPRQG